MGHGIIPARAGFTVCLMGDRCGAGDHPRSRGVYVGAPDGPGWKIGSSPLARGLPPPCGASSPRVRIIPARAGFTSGPVSLPCGKAGSSPLARGLRREAPNRNRHSRIIPARAGFTSGPEREDSVAVDHPRSRGVYLSFLCFYFCERGSSPLARGLRLTAERKSEKRGSSPLARGLPALLLQP